jgi:hypothetical protein
MKRRSRLALVSLAIAVALVSVPATTQANGKAGNRTAMTTVKKPGRMSSTVAAAKRQAMRPFRWMGKKAAGVALKAGNVALTEAIKSGKKAGKSLTLSLQTEEGKETVNQMAGVAGSALGNALREAMTSSQMSPRIRITIDVDFAKIGAGAAPPTEGK